MGTLYPMPFNLWWGVITGYQVILFPRLARISETLIRGRSNGLLYYVIQVSESSISELMPLGDGKFRVRHFQRIERCIETDRQIVSPKIRLTI